jgi:hypothetical protein
MIYSQTIGADVYLLTSQSGHRADHVGSMSAGWVMAFVDNRPCVEAYPTHAVRTYTARLTWVGYSTARVMEVR